MTQSPTAGVKAYLSVSTCHCQERIRLHRRGATFAESFTRGAGPVTRGRHQEFRHHRLPPTLSTEHGNPPPTRSNK